LQKACEVSVALTGYVHVNLFPFYGIAIHGMEHGTYIPLRNVHIGEFIVNIDHTDRGTWDIGFPCDSPYKITWLKMILSSQIEEHTGHPRCYRSRTFCAKTATAIAETIITPAISSVFETPTGFAITSSFPTILPTAIATFFFP